MTQSLRINQKEYLPSAVLSKQFGYSSDYISKLAREEKILASQIGRQWFVEPESLKIFSMQAEFEKKIRKEKLSQERKIERTKKSVSSKCEPTQTSFDFDVLAQAALVLVCGFFVGYLSWISLDSNLQLADFDRGSQQALSLLSEVTMPDISISRSVDHVTSLLFSNKKNVHFSETSRQNISYQTAGFEEGLVGNFSDLPQFPQRQVADTQEIVSENYAQKMFSDEVEVLLGEGGAVMVRPVFKSNTQTGRTFSVTPALRNPEN